MGGGVIFFVILGEYFVVFLSFFYLDYDLFWDLVFAAHKCKLEKWVLN